MLKCGKKREVLKAAVITLGLIAIAVLVVILIGPENLPAWLTGILPHLFG